jgi:hypothetical protein
MTSNIKTKIIYTIMPDFGGAYGWTIEDGDENTGVGVNHAGYYGWEGEHSISESLQKAFAEWQLIFDKDDSLWQNSHQSSFDWDSFHATGLKLCFLLKQELGDDVRIIYEKPFEDPNREQHERLEILLDGNVLELPNRNALSIES